MPDETVLDWFRRGWEHDDPDAWIDSELGGDVYGLGSIFEEVRKHGLPQPETIDELRELLNEHLWVEGDDDGAFIRLGEHALRVRTDDDEVDLAYYFVDDVAATASPDRLAFLLHDTWPLPFSAATEGRTFDHGVPVRTVRLVPPGPESVFSVRLCWESPDTDRNLDLAGATVFPGLNLPGLATQLRCAEDPDIRRWPHDARLLRALVAPRETDIGPALERYARLPGYALTPTILDRTSTHDTVHREMREMMSVQRPAEALLRLDPHIAQVGRYIDNFFGFDQWFVFDTRWAAAHPDLARSLLRYAADWDPYAT
ncbi:hypothetical protein [Verrucosispora sp. ts21]|uniref:hypothetical protein n=1 Tax=Verrucosispora sp. ts21 TaxID=2069341 RepID=UPI001E48065C|nr:hypothetical protein [Verrucosispora sp. ts21]